MLTVIFDLDGTLTKSDDIPFLFLCLNEFGIRKFSTILIPFYILLYIFGIINNKRLKEIFLHKILSGITLNQLESVTEKFTSSLMSKGLNWQTVEILNKHLNQKHKVILATASFDFYTIRLAEKLGIKHVVSTISEIKKGIITGRISGNNCHGQEKVKRLEYLLNQSEWKDSIFYTDHHSDLPLLKRVNQGFLVYPSLKTRILLKKFNFSTLELR